MTGASLLLRRRRRRLDMLCAAGRPTYVSLRPFGADCELDLGGHEDVPVVVEASFLHAEEPTWECPGERGGIVIDCVWMQRHGCWVDITRRLSGEQLERLTRQMGH